MEQDSEEKNRETSEIIVECNGKIEKLENGCNSDEIMNTNFTREENVSNEMSSHSDNDLNTEQMDVSVENTDQDTDIMDKSEFIIPHNKSLSLLTQYSSTSDDDSEHCSIDKESQKAKKSIDADTSSDSSDTSEDEGFMKRVAPILAAIKKNEPPGISEALSNDDDDDEEEEKEKSYGPKVRGEISINELPPIEELQITVPETECVELGKVTSIVDHMILIEALPGTVPLDLDTVLFLDHGKRTLGKIFDVLGQINNPLYCIRFNSLKEIENKQIVVGTEVFCAPRTEYTSFVILSNLMSTKGCDASWEHDVETDTKHADFSDDEEERAANKARKLKNKKETEEPKRKQIDNRAGRGGYGGYSGGRQPRHNQPRHQQSRHRLPSAYPNPTYPQYYRIPPPVYFSYPPPIQYPPGIYGPQQQPVPRPPMQSQHTFNPHQQQPPPPGEY